MQAEVLQQAPRIVLGRKGRDLIAGITQHMHLTLHAGTLPIEKVCVFLHYVTLH